MEMTIRNTCIQIPNNAQTRRTAVNRRSAEKERSAMPKTTVPMRALRQQKIPCRK